MSSPVPISKSALEKQLSRGPSKKAKSSAKKGGKKSKHKLSKSIGGSSGFPSSQAGLMAAMAGQMSPAEKKRGGSSVGDGLRAMTPVKKKTSNSSSTSITPPAMRKTDSTSKRLSSMLRGRVSKKEKSGTVVTLLSDDQLQLLRDDRVRVFGIELTTLLDRERKALGLREYYRGDGALESDSRVPEEFKSGHVRHCIPFVVTQTVEYLRKTGAIAEPGLFRLCGKFAAMTSAQNAVDDGLALSEADLSKMDTHTIGDLFKCFLRLLPHSIIPRPYCKHYVAAASLKEEADRLKYIAALTHCLPADNWQLVRYLCEFFHEIMGHAEKNKMGTANLAIIFAPALFGQSTSNDQFELLKEVKATSTITGMLIDLYPKIFTETHEMTGAIMVAKESYNSSNGSFLKGEEFAVFYRTDGSMADQPDVLVGGRLVTSISHSVLESKASVHEVMFATRFYEVNEEGEGGELELLSTEANGSMRSTMGAQQLVGVKSPGVLSQSGISGRSASASPEDMTESSRVTTGLRASAGKSLAQRRARARSFNGNSAKKQMDEIQQQVAETVKAGTPNGKKSKRAK